MILNYVGSEKDIVDAKKECVTHEANLKKFNNLPLPGNVVLNGDKIYDEAEEEIKALEEKMESEFGAPLEFFLN